MTTKHGLSLVCALAWTALATGLGVCTLGFGPLAFELDAGVLLINRPAGIAKLWALGLVPVLGGLIRRRGLRNLVGVVWACTILVGCLWLIASGPERPVGSAESASMVAGRNRTTLLLAVDGMSWTAALPLLRRGELPHLSRLMEEGSYGVLHSLRSYRKKTSQWGYWSPVVWTSMATGVRPPRHGITDFTLTRIPGVGSVASSSHRRAAAFWNLFSTFDRTVGVVGWWASWPAEEVSGYMASSHLGLRGHRRRAPTRSGLTHPPELLEELSGVHTSPRTIEDWVDEEIFPFQEEPVLDPDSMDAIYTVLWQDRLYLDVAKHLIEREPLDLYAVYFEGIDALSHHFWRSMIHPEDDFLPLMPEGYREHRRIVPESYRILDSYLGELLELLPEDVTVLIVSDHGFRLVDDEPKGAGHSPYGVIVARGPGIARGESLNLDPLGSLREMVHGRTDILDVLPTLLYLHGLPVAEDLPGRVIGAWLTEDLRERQPLVTVESYGDFSGNRDVEVDVDPAASEEYEERLRALGYID